jgi:hypothetical protein
MDALRREVALELDALERRIGTGAMPGAIDLRVETDQRTGMPRAVELTPTWRRHILGGSVTSRRAS